MNFEDDFGPREAEMWPMVIRVGGSLKVVPNEQQLPVGQDFRIVRKSATLLSKQHMKYGHWYEDVMGQYRYSLTVHDGKTVILCWKLDVNTIYTMKDNELPNTIILDVH